MTFPELLFIFVLGLILFGPEELPKIARTVGKIIYEIKQAATDVQTEVRKSVLEQPPQQEPSINKAACKGQEIPQAEQNE